MHPSFVPMRERDGAAFAVLESITDAFFALDLTWEFTYVNSQAEHVLGYSRDELLGRTIWSRYPGLAGSEFERQYRDAARNQKASSSTAFYPDHQRWYEVHVYPAATGISVYFRNVTEQISTQQALAEKIAKLEEIERKQAFQISLAETLRHMDDPAAICEAGCAMLGQAVGADRVFFNGIDMPGGGFSVKCGWSRDGLLPAAPGSGPLDQFAAPLLASLQSGDAEVALASDLPPALRHTAAGAALAVPFVQRGELLAILVLYRAGVQAWPAYDIELARCTAERTWTSKQYARAQSDLKAERDQSKHIFQSMSEGFAIIDGNWTMLQINAMGLDVGQRSGGDVIGRTVWDVWPEIIGTDIDTRYRNTMRTRIPDAFEDYVQFSKGVGLWLEFRLLPVLGGGMAVHYRDISERRRIEEQLLDADRRKDEFLAMLAHELRNPLAPISAAADLLRMTNADPKRVRQTSEVISRQVRHLTSLVDDLLDVSRVTRGQIVLEKEVLDARRIVADAVEQVQPLIDTRRHQLVLQIVAESVYVLGDHKRLVQVLTNLLNNAAKYTPEGGRIAVSMEAAASMVKITVADNGIGMAPALVAHAFDLFAQAERTSDRAQGGLGIGLALVRSLVALHCGEVSVNSRGLGQGSEFIVLLPQVAAPLS